MGQLGGEEIKEVVHVKAKKYDGYSAPEIKRFSIDPSLTNYRTLRELLAKAFQIKGDFVISYMIPRRRSDEEDRFLPMLCDWDLNAAIYGSAQQQLVLKVDMKPFEEGLEEWDIIVPDDLDRVEQQQKLPAVPSSAASVTGKMKQISLFGTSKRRQKQHSSSVKSPMTDAEFRSLLDAEGRVLNPERLRLLVYQGGVEPSLRPVVWRHLLNIYPQGLTGEERISYTKSLAEKYSCLKECWQQKLRSGRSADDVRVVANAVRKDVIRTDRAHPYFSGEEETNGNVLALFNILTTFALTHPEVAYCQGMSDMASPLLVVMKDEAQAYICFCALMQRLEGNFMCDGRVMTRKFKHLSDLLQFYDPVFFEYLREMHAEDLLFCYRWLLLELKREFTFEDALLALEVMWASLPPEFPESSLPLFEVDLTACDEIEFSPRLRFPTSNRALKLLNLGEQSDLRPESVASTETDSTVDSSGRTTHPLDLQSCAGNESDSEADHLFTFDSTRTLQVSNEQTVQLGTTLSSAHSCPGSLSGLCHAAVVRSLMLGKSSEAPLHSCHPNFSYPPKFFISDNNGSLVRKHCQRKSRRLHSESCTDTEHSSEPKFIVGSYERAAQSTFSPLMEEEPSDNAFLFDIEDEEETKDGLDPREDRDLCSDTACDEQTKDTKEFRRGSFSSGATINYPWSIFVQERRIKPSSELPVADDSASEKPEDTERNVSPVPVASEATVVVDENSDQTELTLTDVYDICVAQVAVGNSQLSPPSSVIRSRQTSGEATGRGNPSPREPSSSGIGTGGSKSRHASSTQAAPDSGCGGTTTPYTHSVDLLPSDGLMTSSSAPTLSSESKKNNHVDRKLLLPPPEEFGDGNPFMMFVCLTLLIEHRNRIMKRGMDFNEIAIYFDKLARNHNAQKILKRARFFYSDYLRSDWFLVSEDAS